MKSRLSCVAGLAAAVLAGTVVERRSVAPPGVTPVGPYSPGVVAGDCLYVSGQGAKNSAGEISPSVEEQVRQCLRNVESVVRAAGLTMEHVVYTQAYLTHATDEGPMNRVWKEFFPKAPPARSTIGVANLPGTPVEVSAVAVRDLSQKRLVVPPGYPPDAPLTPGVFAGDRLYLSGFLGRDIATGRIPTSPAEQVQLSLDRMLQTLRAAGMDFRHVVFMNPYLTAALPMRVMNEVYAKHFEFGNTPARATIQVAELPNGANIEFTGIAIRDLARRRAIRPRNMAPSPTASPCVFAGDTLYCSAKSGFIPGPRSGIYAASVEHQLRQTMRNLLDGLEEAGMDFSNVVASNVYLDDIADFAKMNSVYAQYFAAPLPSRTTVQQMPRGSRVPDNDGRWPTLEQISIVAVK